MKNKQKDRKDKETRIVSKQALSLFLELLRQILASWLVQIAVTSLLTGADYSALSPRCRSWTSEVMSRSGTVQILSSLRQTRKHHALDHDVLTSCACFFKGKVNLKVIRS